MCVYHTWLEVKPHTQPIRHNSCAHYHKQFRHHPLLHLVLLEYASAICFPLSVTKLMHHQSRSPEVKLPNALSLKEPPAPLCLFAVRRLPLSKPAHACMHASFAQSYDHQTGCRTLCCLHSPEAVLHIVQDAGAPSFYREGQQYWQAFSLTSFALSLLMVFKTNSSYHRCVPLAEHQVLVCVCVCVCV